MRVGVVVFPGSNCEHDVVEAMARVGAEAMGRAGADSMGPAGAGARLVWHGDHRLGDVDAVVLPGGFAHGDALRPGAIARFSPIMAAVAEFARGGGPVVGICNGFQILTEAGLLPGVLRPNASLSFVCRDVDVVVERVDTPFTARCREGETLTIPVKHGDGCWFGDDELVARLETNRQVALRYGPGANPNGSLGDVAGVCNEDGNVFGLMPHPEHAVDPLLGSTDGALVLGSLVDAAQLSLTASLR